VVLVEKNAEPDRMPTDAKEVDAEIFMKDDTVGCPGN